MPKSLKVIYEDGVFKPLQKVDLKEHQQVELVIEKFIEDIPSSQQASQAGRLSFAVNRIYYACFYAISAVLLQEKLRFKKHSGVRAAFHQHLVKLGIVSREHGQLYDELFEARQRGDYMELVYFDKKTELVYFDKKTELVYFDKKTVLVYFDKKTVEDWLQRAKGFVEVGAAPCGRPSDAMSLLIQDASKK